MRAMPEDRADDGEQRELGPVEAIERARCGCLGAFLGQVERGQRNVTQHNILKLAEVLGVDPGELVHGLRAPDGGSE
jgi:hypothetical protein